MTVERRSAAETISLAEPPALAVEPRPLSAAPPATRNVMTIDVEDYFHVEALASVIDRGTWEELPRRVERNTNRLLEILGLFGATATFFILSWVAERHPRLVRRILAQGHEVASHGVEHRRADQQSPGEFRQDIRRSKKLLEDIGGAPVLGFRAATFSIGRRNPWTYSILLDEGYRYSSSVFPIAHDLYGEPKAPRIAFQPIPGLVEIPPATVRLLGRNFPAAGGGYFRLLPYRISRWAIRQAGQAGQTPCVFYLHPWEIDPDQPRPPGAPARARFRHYLNLSRTEARLARLLRDFAWGRMDTVFLSTGAGEPPVLRSWLG